jgi:5-methylcytosine-specific restriction enzyme B
VAFVVKARRGTDGRVKRVSNGGFPRGFHGRDGFSGPTFGGSSRRVQPGFGVLPASRIAWRLAMPRASDVTSRNAVLAAIAEFDEIGRDAFLNKYGFGPSREYVVVENGRQYDSKALLGAAYSHQFGGAESLRSDDFSGGDETRRVLERLGFEVRSISDEGDSAEVPTLELRDGIERILGDYGQARSGQFGSTAEVWGTFESLNEVFNTSLPVTSRPTVSARWSAGRGNWARIPWISFLDARETRTTQRGVYPVLLFREDLSGAYLTLAQGVTEPGRLGRAGMVAHLESVAFEVRRQSPELRAAGFQLDSAVDLKTSASLGRNYEHSVIAHKLYEKGRVPDDREILRDLEAVLVAYDRYIENRPTTAVGTASDQPNAFLIYVGGGSETNLRVGLERGVWGFPASPTDLPSVRVGDLVVFASGYTGGSPRVSPEEWTNHGLRRIVLGRVTRPAYADASPVWPDEGTDGRAYPHRFTFDELGTYEDIPLGSGEQLSSLAAEKLRMSAINRGHGYLAPIEGSPLLESVLEAEAELPTVPLSEIAQRFSQEIQKSGLVLPEERAVACLAALMAKPFAIFTGLSGSGKTQLALRLGDWFGAAGSEPRHLVVAVRPDWSGPEALFGYEDALQPRSPDGRAAWHVPTPLKFMLKALNDSERPYLMILDEMNLAHVERYFSDYLSAAESREPILPNLVLESSGGVQSWRIRPGAPELLPIPRNLWVVGTVNIDETTYMFSPKVLDRAFVFEFRVTTEELAGDTARPSSVPAADPAVLRSLLAISRDDQWHYSEPHAEREHLVEELRNTHALLAASSHEFGHRVMAESLRFAAIYSGCGREELDEALDLIAMQKLLPRLHGSRRRLERVLRDLMAWAGVPDVGDSTEQQVVGARLPRTAAKLSRMLASLEANQFVSFTE